jgi:predicted nucleic acid-binding protein
MIVDSCILTDISRGNQAALNFLLHQNERPSISMLTVVEVMRGVRKPSEETLFRALFDKMVCVPWNSIFPCARVNIFAAMGRATA